MVIMPKCLNAARCLVINRKWRVESVEIKNRKVQ